MEDKLTDIVQELDDSWFNIDDDNDYDNWGFPTNKYIGRQYDND